MLPPLLADGRGQTPELFLRPGHLGLETVAGLQPGKADGSGHPRHVHIALPMRTGDDAALSVLPGPGVQTVRRSRIDLGQQQRSCPAPHRMTGRITAFAAQGGFLAGKHLLVEHFERTATVVEGFRSHAHLVRRSQTVHQHGPDGRCRLLRKSQTERPGQLSQQGFIGPDGIPSGHFGPHGVRPLGLSPLVLHHIIREPMRKGVRRCRKALDQVRQLVRREINLLGMAHDCGQEQGGRQDDILFHRITSEHFYDGREALQRP